jgi:hypothetical protein
MLSLRRESGTFTVRMMVGKKLYDIVTRFNLAKIL